jgi:hypothetical protein
MTLPLAGHPVGVVDAKQAKSPLELIHSAYRFLLGDLMPFGQRAKICFEHGGENESVEHYRSVTHWYGLPGANLVLTDSMQVGDLESEREHHYRSPDATAPYDVTSRYELGPDHLSARSRGRRSRRSISWSIGSRRSAAGITSGWSCARATACSTPRCGWKSTTTSAAVGRERIHRIRRVPERGSRAGHLPISNRDRAGIGGPVRA